MTAVYISITLVAWASAFVAIRIAVRDFSPGSFVLLRFLVCAALVSLAVVPRYGVRRFFTLSRGDLVRLVVMGISGAVLYNLFLAQGQRTVSAFGASLLINTVPIWTAILAVLALRERLDRLAWAGVLVGFAGAILVGSKDGGFSLGVGGAVSILLAAGCQAVYFVTLRSVVARVGAGRSTALTFLFAVVASLPFAGSLLRELGEASATATGAVIYIGLVPGGIGVWTWARAAERLPASRQVIFLYFVPPLAALMAWGVLGEAPTMGIALGGLVTVAGVAIVNWPRRRRGARRRLAAPTTRATVSPETFNEDDHRSAGIPAIEPTRRSPWVSRDVVRSGQTEARGPAQRGELEGSACWRLDLEGDAGVEVGHERLDPLGRVRGGPA